MPTDHKGRCYCGATTFHLTAKPLIVAMCHCADCMRWTGSPSPVFVAFPKTALHGALGDPFVASTGVQRWNCRMCGSPIAATFPYLPDQVYIAVGVLDDARDMTPDLQCYAGAKLPWVHVSPTLPEASDSGQETLNAAQGGKP